MAKMKFRVKGMHCQSCEKVIENAASSIEGVECIKADYETETAEVVFDPEKVRISGIFKAIGEKGYSCSKEDDTEEDELEGSYSFNKKTVGTALGIVGVLVAAYFIFTLSGSIEFPEISKNMGYGLLFLVGLLTGFHCVGMCGGFVISYTAKGAQEGKKLYSSHFMYGLGKTVSYTVIGAAFGLLGSIIVFTPAIRGAAGIIAGLFLVIFGLNMLNIFSWLRKFSIRMPSALSRFVGTESRKHNDPWTIGLLNGLMIACGPLQAVYIMAAATGSMLEGAKLLFIFALGTLPVMLGFGFIAGIISQKAAHKILKASGAIVIVLGLIMINRGLALTGTGFDSASIISSVTASENKVQDNAAAIENGYQVIRMDVNRYGWAPDKFVLKKDIPVRWIINGKELNGCNKAIQVPKLNLKFDIRPGQQTIEFTPIESGIIPWSCWMGMIQGTFIIKDDINANDAAAIKKELNAVKVPKAASCGGGCGCGK